MLCAVPRVDLSSGGRFRYRSGRSDGERTSGDRVRSRRGLETVVPGVTGVLFDMQTPDLLIDAIHRVEAMKSTYLNRWSLLPTRGGFRRIASRRRWHSR